MKDYYAILGVPPSAGQADIKRAFRKLAVRYHPDKNRSPLAKTLFQEINEAYDTLSDPHKRALYDVRRENPFADIVGETVTPHRDPAYRRRQYARPRKQEPSPTYVLMRDYLKYVNWISRIGLLSSTLFFLDYFLPYHQAEEHISQIVAVRFGRSISSYLITTQEGSRIRVYDFEPRRFGHEGAIRVVRTTVYRTVMTIANAPGTYILRVGYMYRSLLWIPIILFVNSLLALLLKKHVEWCFNLNITCLMWLIMSFILL